MIGTRMATFGQDVQWSVDGVLAFGAPVIPAGASKGELNAA
jgi:hypothetical protein